jgi:hypothetical protein
MRNAYNILAKKRNIERKRPLGRPTCKTQEFDGLVEKGCRWTDVITLLCVRFLTFKASNACN